MKNFSYTLPLIAPLLFVFLSSTGFIGAKFGLPHAGPLSFLLVRYLFVASLMLTLALVTSAPWPRDARQWLHIAISGLLVHCIYLGGVYLSIADGLPLGIASVIVALQPLLTAVGAAALLSERVTKSQWIGLFLGLLGTIFVVFSRFGSGVGLVGLPAAFAALFGITAGTLYQKRFCPSFDFRSGSVIQFVPCALMTWVAMGMFETFSIEWTGEFLFALSWLTLVMSFGSVGLFNYLIRSGSATNLASLFILVPPCTAIIAWMIFGENLSAPAVLGMVLAVSGVYLARKNPMKA